MWKGKRCLFPENAEQAGCKKLLAEFLKWKSDHKKNPSKDSPLTEIFSIIILFIWPFYLIVQDEWCGKCDSETLTCLQPKACCINRKPCLCHCMWKIRTKCVWLMCPPRTGLFPQPVIVGIDGLMGLWWCTVEKCPEDLQTFAPGCHLFGYCDLGDMNMKAVQTTQSKSASVKDDGALNLQDYTAVCPGHNQGVHSDHGKRL